MMNCYNCTLNWRSVLATLTLGMMMSMASLADDLGVTMRMVGSDEDLTREIVQEIQLPERLDDAPGRSGEAPGLERAREARELGRGAAEQARERREATGRPDDLPGKGSGRERPEIEEPETERPDPSQGSNPRLD